MFKVAEKIAEKENCEFLITGENLGQVASQTLENIYVTEKAIKMKILRPLLCNDKIEIIKIAREIGSYDISIEAGMCCTAVPPNPILKSEVKKVEYEEEKLNTDEIIQRSIENASVL